MAKQGGESEDPKRRAVVIRRMIEAAEAAGSHAPGGGAHLCHACREWCEIYWITMDGRRLCFVCSMKNGAFPDLSLPELERYAHSPSPIPGDPTFPERCLAELDRRRKARASVQAWARDFAGWVARGRPREPMRN